MLCHIPAVKHAIQAGHGLATGAGEQAVCLINLPPGALPAGFSGNRSAFWELEVNLHVRRLDFRQILIVRRQTTVW